MLDVFFEALNYETIEQKKAYEVAGLLGMSAGLAFISLNLGSSLVHLSILDMHPMTVMIMSSAMSP